MSKREKTAWQKELAQGRREFIDDIGRGRQMEIEIIWAKDLPKLIFAGDRGNKAAQHLVKACAVFFSMVNEAEKDGAYPGCVGCNRQLVRGDLGAFAIMHPHQADGVGMTAPFCSACSKLDADEMVRRFRATLEDTYPVQTVMMQ